MTVDVGDELPEEHAEFCLEELSDLLAEGKRCIPEKCQSQGGK